MWCPVLESLVGCTLTRWSMFSGLWGSGAHKVYKKRLRELDLFGVYQIRVWKDAIAVFSDLVGGWGEEGVRLFSQVHSDRLRSSRDMLQHKKFWLDVWKGILPWEWSDTWRDCLGNLGNLHPCRLSKLCWVRLSIAWSSRTRFEWEAGLDDLQSFLLIYIILWFCEGIKAVQGDKSKDPRKCCELFQNKHSNLRLTAQVDAAFLVNETRKTA